MINVMLWAGLIFSSGSQSLSSGRTTSDAYRKERHMLKRRIKMQSLGNWDVSKKWSLLYVLLSCLASGLVRIADSWRGRVLGLHAGCCCYLVAGSWWPCCFGLVPPPILQMLWSVDLSHGLHSALALAIHLLHRPSFRVTLSSGGQLCLLLLAAIWLPHWEHLWLTGFLPHPPHGAPGISGPWFLVCCLYVLKCQF